MPAPESSSPPFIDPYDNRVLLAYFDALEARHSKIRLLGLPSMAKLKEGEREIPIDRLFVRPNFLTNNWREGGRDQAIPLEDAIRENFRLIVLGDPGSGKSTAIDWLTTAFAHGARHRAVREFGRLVPLPLIVRDLELPSGEFGWEELLEAFLKRPMAAPLAENPKLLNQLLESGQAYILLDGIDEIAHRGWRSFLRTAVHDGWKKFPSCRWLITSRIVGYSDVEFHSGGEDQVIRFQAIAEKTADPLGGLLGDYDEDEVVIKAPSGRVLYLAPFDDGQIERFSRNWFQRYESDPTEADRKASDFTKDIRLASPILDLARTPNLLTLMALIYYSEAELPNGRAMLYKKIADAYLETIDRFRKLGFEQAFGKIDRFNFLSRVAFEMQERRSTRDVEGNEAETSAGQEILISKSDLEAMLGKTISDSRADEFIDEFLSYIGRRTGLLIPRGIGEGDEEHYAFAHLSFQEYFAACHLEQGVVQDPDWDSGNGDPQLEKGKLRGLTLDPAWQEVFYLFFEIVSEADRSKKRATRLIEKLFPENSESDAAMPLLSRILADPHCELVEKERRDQIARCWRREIGIHRELAKSTDGRFASFTPEITINLTGETSAFSEMAGDIWKNELPERTSDPDHGALIDGSIALCDLKRKRPLRFGIDSLKSDLVAIIEKERLPAAGRALAGHLLGSLGDPRPGVTWNPPGEDSHGGFRCLPLGGVEFSIYPVTNDQFRPFVEEGGYDQREFWTETGWEWKVKVKIQGPGDSGGKFQSPNHPRVGVSWYEAVAYCRWLSKKLDRGVRLPSDDEWEAAVNPKGDRKFPWGNEEENLVERANFAPGRNAILGSTCPVGVYPKGMTHEGLFDVAGNVWEWSLSKTGESGGEDKDSIEGRFHRVLRGGAWFYSRRTLACSARADNHSGGRGGSGGFRVVFAATFQVSPEMPTGSTRRTAASCRTRHPKKR